MPKTPTPTKEQFDVLMTWLGSGSEDAGSKYERIRQTLVKLFAWHGCWDAEDLADVTIDRVTRKVSQVMIDYSGDPTLYFYGVAKKLLMERRRENAHRSESPLIESNVSSGGQPVTNSEDDWRFECLEKCIGELPPESRKLIIDYYQQEKRAKIDFRLEIAKRMGTEVKNLRLKAFRIRTSLFKCMKECLGDVTLCNESPPKT